MSDLVRPARSELAAPPNDDGAGGTTEAALSGDSASPAAPRERSPLQRWLLASGHARTLFAQFVIVGAFLLLWQLLAGQPRQGAVLDELFLGRPSLIFQRTVTWLLDGTLVRNAWVTIQEALVGFAIGSCVGISAGLIFGATRLGQAILAPLVFIAYAVPRLALAPLFILWFGIGTESKIALVSLIVFFYVFFNAYEGSRQVDDDLIAVCRMMKASRWQILMKVIVPSAMMWVAVGLKVSVPHAFTGAIVGEIIAGRMGLGTLISKSSHALDANGLFSAALVTALLAIAVNAIVARGVAFGLRWRQESATGTGTDLL